ncbi:MAG TPA: acetyl-coenzyme A synthetase, partial [Rhodospirillales bacterium]|nr:acetyl-coenzyme A synthetase [Rhodospirillales bacterium]
MSEDYLFPVSDDIAKTAWLDNDKYLKWYGNSLEDPEAFWREHGKRIDWIKPYTKIKDVDYEDDARIRW